jgi:hypothetical protein
MCKVGLAVDEGVEPIGERGEGVAVTLVLKLEVGDHRDEVLSSRVVGPEFDGEARGGEVELEILDVKLTVVDSLAGERGEAGEPLGHAGDGLEPVEFVALGLTPLLLGRGDALTEVCCNGRISAGAGWLGNLLVR